MDWDLWHCTGGSNQNHPQEQDMQKGKMVVWGGLTNSWEKKQCKRQRRRGKIYIGHWVSEWVKVAQLCPTLCDPMDYIVHGIHQARILEWVAISFSRGLPNPGIELRSPALKADSLPAEPQGKPTLVIQEMQIQTTVRYYFTPTKMVMHFNRDYNACF